MSGEKEKKIDLMLPRGMKDYQPEEKIFVDSLINELREVFELYGFMPLSTPALERWEVLSAKYAGGSEILKEAFRLKDQGDRQLGLRYDLTVPLARFVGMNPNIKMPFKRYQIDRVWRDGPIKLGRYREFLQCDVDVVGCKSMLVEAELLALSQEVFKRLGLDVIIKVNNRKLLNGLIGFAGIEKEKAPDAILSVDKLAKIGFDGVKKELIEKKLDEKQAEKLLKALMVSGSNNEVLEQTKKLIKDEEGMQGIKELEELIDYCRVFGCDLDRIKLESSLARGLAYYTGTVFEVYLSAGELSSAIAAGGRFDEMINDFLGVKDRYPAAGISFGLDVIMDALKLKGRQASKKTNALAYVIPIQETREGIKIVGALRKAGIKADIDLVGRGPSKNFDYANALGIPFALVIGPDEVKQKKVKLKDMKTGNEKLLGLQEAIKELKKSIN